MLQLLKTDIGRLRILGFIEGMSMLILLFIAMPLKYIWDAPGSVRVVGAIHGALFVLFVLNTLQIAIAHKWKFMHTTWKVLLGSILPFGTFYVDSKVLKPITESSKSSIS